MTPTPAPAPALDQLVLRSPDALVAAVPYLLGFHPRESAVAVWLQDRRIALTQRLDLPGTSADHQPWLGAMWHHPMSEAADELILVVASAQPADPALLALVLDRAADAGIEVRDALRIDGGRWWSLLCIDEGCCPPEGREVEAATASAVAAEFTVIGRAPLAAREDLETSLGPVADEVAAVALALDALPGMPIGAAREPWRDARIVSALGFLDGDPDGDRADAAGRTRAIADLLCGLEDVRVRDTRAVGGLARGPGPARRDPRATVVRPARRACRARGARGIVRRHRGVAAGRWCPCAHRDRPRSPRRRPVLARTAPGRVAGGRAAPGRVAREHGRPEPGPLPARRRRTRRRHRPDPTCPASGRAAIFPAGQEFQQTAPASWTATLHRGGVLRMKTWPAWRASAGLAQGKTPECARSDMCCCCRMQSR